MFESQLNTCRLCEIDYDYILKLETIDQGESSLFSFYTFIFIFRFSIFDGETGPARQLERTRFARNSSPDQKRESLRLLFRHVGAFATHRPRAALLFRPEPARLHVQSSQEPHRRLGLTT